MSKTIERGRERGGGFAVVVRSVVVATAVVVIFERLGFCYAVGAAAGAAPGVPGPAPVLLPLGDDMINVDMISKCL